MDKGAAPSVCSAAPTSPSLSHLVPFALILSREMGLSPFKLCHTGLCWDVSVLSLWAHDRNPLGSHSSVTHNSFLHTWLHSTCARTQTSTDTHANASHCHHDYVRECPQTEQPWTDSVSHKSCRCSGGGAVVGGGQGEGQGQCISSRGQKVNCRALPPGPFIIPVTQTDYTTHTVSPPPTSTLFLSSSFPRSPSSLTWSSSDLFLLRLFSPCVFSCCP